jgi:FMN reductase
MRSIVVVSGNPRPASKTTAVATALAEAIAQAIAVDIPAQVTVIELADLGPAVLEHGNQDVTAQRERVASADLLVVATPSYKGSYTGPLKAFFDGYGPTSLRGVPAVALTVAASPAHAHITGEFHLVPLLHEVGADTPLGALGVLESEAADATARAARVESWVEQRRAVVRAVWAATREAEVSA